MKIANGTNQELSYIQNLYDTMDKEFGQDRTLRLSHYTPDFDLRTISLRFTYEGVEIKIFTLEDEFGDAPSDLLITKLKVMM